MNAGRNRSKTNELVITSKSGRELCRYLPTEWERYVALENGQVEVWTESYVTERYTDATARREGTPGGSRF